VSKYAALLLILCLSLPVPVPALALADTAGLDVLLDELAAPGSEAGVAPLLWQLASDDSFATGFLESVDARQLVLADTLLFVLRLPEPQARPLFPQMYEVSDLGPPPGGRDPAWADLRWAGVRWMRRILDHGVEGRDQRLRTELDAAMSTVDRPQRAEMGGLVLILVHWWADRGLDPALTQHRPPRDPAAPVLQQAALGVPDGSTAAGLQLLMAMDRDPVVGDRLLDRLDPARTAWLVRDLVLAVELNADSLYSIGIEQRRWDAQAGVARGHNIVTLRRLALDVLDATAPDVQSGPDDLSRRVARLSWWDEARYQARYWADPLDAPDFSIFLLGLRKPADEGGRDLLRWVRLIYLQPVGVQERILEQLGPLQQPVVAELMGLAAAGRVEAADQGFRMVYTRRPLVAAEGSRPVAVAIDWEQVRRLIRQMLAPITGQYPPAVLASAPRSQAAWWADWWDSTRDNEGWYRGELDDWLVLPATTNSLDLRPRSGRVD